MGEEIGAQKRYTFDSFPSNRGDIRGGRAGDGKALFRYHQDLIGLGGRLRAGRSHNIDILHQWNRNRVIAFKRWSGGQEVANGYVIEKNVVAIPNAGWKEIFNSDAAIYGGQNMGNGGATLLSNQGRLIVAIPANGFVVLVKQ
jgi:1,4-alpha-glucan branching enzyme